MRLFVPRIQGRQTKDESLITYLSPLLSYEGPARLGWSHSIVSPFPKKHKVDNYDYSLVGLIRMFIIKRVGIMCVLRTHIKPFIFSNIVLKIEKVVNTFSILKKIF